MRRILRFFRKPAREKRLILEATLFLGLARFAILFIPFKVKARYLGAHMKKTPNRPVATHKNALIAVARAIQTAGRHAPWECVCLGRSIAGKLMLNRRKIPATLYLGVAKDDDKNLIAHAWLRSGDMMVTGGREAPDFTMVSTFA